MNRKIDIKRAVVAYYNGATSKFVRKEGRWWWLFRLRPAWRSNPGLY